jgi:hypothetical protein
MKGPYTYGDTIVYSGFTKNGEPDGNSKRDTSWDNDYLNLKELTEKGSAQGGIDELASKKQDKTDNNLTTTNKTVVGGINELKSGVTNATTVSSGTITPEEGVTIKNYTLQKSMKTVYLYMLVKFTPTIGTGQLLCVLPSGYRAQSRLIFAGFNGTSGKFVMSETDSHGAVRIYPSSDDSSAVPTDYFLTITFFTS